MQNDPSAAGDAVTLRLEGYSKLTAGGTITAGDLVTSTTGGLGLTATTTGQLCIARAVTASTASGQVITVNMQCPIFYTAGATA